MTILLVTSFLFPKERFATRIVMGTLVLPSNLQSLLVIKEVWFYDAHVADA